MTDSRKHRLNPLALLINAAAIGLVLFVLTMDGSVFIFWLRIGVFDGHWNDVSLQILFVCLIVTFLCFLVVSMLFGLGNQLSHPPDQSNIKPRAELGNLIDSGWERALRTSTTCSIIVLSLLVLFCLSFWQDLLWWTELCRGDRASKELRVNDATALYQSAVEIASPDRKPMSLIFLANQCNEAKRYQSAENYYTGAIAAIKKLPGDNSSLMVWACQGLSRVLMNEGKSSAAEAVLRQAIASFGERKTLPMVQVRVIGSLRVPSMSPPPTLIGTYTLLELSCVKQGKFDEAQTAFQQNLDIFQDLEKPNLKAILGICELYADMLIKAAHARQYMDRAYQAALVLVASKFGPAGDAVGRIETSYADALRSSGAAGDAEVIYSQALSHLKNEGKEGDAVMLRVMNSLAGILSKAGRVDQAEKLYKDEIALVKSWKTSSSEVEIQIDACRAEYAALLEKLNRVDEARQLQSSTAVQATH